MNRWIRKALVAVLAVAAATAAQAQFPSKTVKLVVAFPPGGSTDTTARLIAPKLAEKWGHAVVVENKPGAAANIGTDYVAKSEPDGTTMLLATTAIAISAVVYEKLNYDALRDLAPVTLVSTIPNVLVVNNEVPARDIKAFIAYAKANPGKLNFAAPGAASGQRLTFELIKQLTGTDIVMVPYKGGAPAVQATMAGETQAMIVNVVEAASLVQGGKLRALAATTASRSPLLPDVPTLAETVAPGIDASVWQGVLVPSGTPPAVIAKINADVAAALNAPDVRARLTQLGMTIQTGSPEAFGRFLREEITTWGKVAKAANVKVE
ncbi:MAG TPA: tripartite tricarboxylate transporter substrate binding protein [Burkholderiales bacterium]|nr:tripartite tricarboxylate transporter substrate binding protein [Burkholderiales bacterium]